MDETQDFERSPREPRSFADCRTIDVADDEALRFWSEHLGVPPEEVVETVRQVGPNATAVALKLEAPHEASVAPPIIQAR